MKPALFGVVQLFMIFFMGSASLCAQSIFHTKNIKTISFSGGANPRSVFTQGNIAYHHFLSKTLILGGGINVESGKVGFTRFEDYIIYPEFKYSPKFSIRGRAYINFGTAFYLGVQNARSTRYPDQYTRFMYGLWLMSEIEYFPHKRFGLFAGFRHCYTIPKNLLGHWHYNGNLGLKVVMY